MRFSETQRRIIREICQIEDEVLKELMINPDLERKIGDITYLELLKQMGATHNDWLKAAGAMYKDFKKLYSKPEGLFTMDEYSISVFKQVLVLVEPKFKDKYPKAWINLWNKINVLGDNNDFKYLN